MDETEDAEPEIITVKPPSKISSPETVTKPSIVNVDIITVKKIMPVVSKTTIMAQSDTTNDGPGGVSEELIPKKIKKQSADVTKLKTADKAVLRVVAPKPNTQKISTTNQWQITDTNKPKIYSAKKSNANRQRDQSVKLAKNRTAVNDRQKIAAKNIRKPGIKSMVKPNGKKAKKPFNKQNRSVSSKTVDAKSISDERLRAFGLNPKKYHKKQKYGSAAQAATKSVANKVSNPKVLSGKMAKQKANNDKKIKEKLKQILIASKKLYN